MASGDSPAVARRRVRLAIREARLALGQTQSDVAEAMEWSLSKVQRIEKGDVTIAPNDLKPLLAHLEITGRQQVEALLAAAKVARQRKQWWDDPRFRANTTPAMLQLASYELEAVESYLFAPMVLPGALQTREYAATILDSYAYEIPRAIREMRIEFRMRRRRELFSRATPPVVRAIIDQAILARTLGDPDMHRAQMLDLLETVDKADVRIRVMPFEIKVAVPMLGAFDLHYLGGSPADPEENAVMYRESGDQDEIVDEVEKVRRHRSMFDRWWLASYDEADSQRMIAERARKA